MFRDKTMDERKVVTTRLARLAERRRALSAAYTALLDRVPATDDQEALDAWRRRLDQLYAEKDAIVAQRVALRQRLLHLDEVRKAA